jgi:hypothetical protein
MKLNSNSVPTKKNPKPDGFIAEIYLIFKVLAPSLHRLLHKIESKGILLNSYLRSQYYLIPKLNKDTHTKIYRPTFLVNTVAKILKILETEFNNKF